MATIKQKRAFKVITENPRASIGSAMREAGYSKVTATKPSDMTNSQSWQELMETYLPDKKLAEVHQRGLDAKRSIVIDKEIIEVPDQLTQKQYLELAYKIKGKIKDNVQVTIADKYKAMSDDELSNIIDGEIVD
jgi:hypothetical protein